MEEPGQVEINGFISGRFSVRAGRKPFQEILPSHIVKLLEGAINTVVTTNQALQFGYSMELALLAND